MSKMGMELDHRLDQHKYTMYWALQAIAKDTERSCAGALVNMKNLAKVVLEMTETV